MLITRMYCISKDPAMFITGSFYSSTAYAKTCLCSPFRNHLLSGSLMLHFCVFTSSGSSSDIESLSFPFHRMQVAGYHLFSSMAFFRVPDDLFQSLYLIPLHTREPVRVQPAYAFFYCLHRLYMCCIHEDLFCIYKLIFHTIFQNL